MSSKSSKRTFKCARCAAAGKKPEVVASHDDDHCYDRPDAKGKTKDSSSPPPPPPPGPAPDPDYFFGHDDPEPPEPKPAGAPRPPTVDDDTFAPGKQRTTYSAIQAKAQALSLSPLGFALKSDFQWARSPSVGLPAVLAPQFEDQSPDVNLHARAAASREYTTRRAIACALGRGHRHILDYAGSDRTQRLLKFLTPDAPDYARVSVEGDLHDPADFDRRHPGGDEPRPDPDCALFVHVYSLTLENGDKCVLTPDTLRAFLATRKIASAYLVRHSFNGQADVVCEQSAWIRTGDSITFRPDSGSQPYEHPTCDDFDQGGAIAGMYWTSESKADSVLVKVTMGDLASKLVPGPRPLPRFVVQELDIPDPDAGAADAVADFLATRAKPLLNAIPGGRTVLGWLRRDVTRRRGLVDNLLLMSLNREAQARQSSAFSSAAVTSSANQFAKDDPKLRVLTTLFPAETANVVANTVTAHQCHLAGPDFMLADVNRWHGDELAERNQAFRQHGQAHTPAPLFWLKYAVLVAAIGLLLVRLGGVFAVLFQRALHALAGPLRGTALGRFLRPPVEHPAAGWFRQIAASRSMRFLFPRLTAVISGVSELHDHAPPFLVQLISQVRYGRGVHSVRSALTRAAMVASAATACIHAAGNAVFSRSRADVLFAFAEEIFRACALWTGRNNGRIYSVALCALELSASPSLADAASTVAYHLAYHSVQEFFICRVPPAQARVQQRRPALARTQDITGAFLEVFPDDLPAATPAYDSIIALPLTLDGVHNAVYKRSACTMPNQLSPNVKMTITGFPDERSTSEKVHYLGGLAVCHNVFGKTDRNGLGLMFRRLGRAIPTDFADQALVWTGGRPLWPGPGDAGVPPNTRMLIALVNATAYLDYMPAAPLPLDVPGQLAAAEHPVRYRDWPTIDRTQEFLDAYIRHLPSASAIRFRSGLAVIGHERIQPQAIRCSKVFTKSNDDILKADGAGRPIVEVDKRIFASIGAEYYETTKRKYAVAGLEPFISNVIQSGTNCPPPHFTLTTNTEYALDYDGNYAQAIRTHWCYVVYGNAAKRSQLSVFPQVVADLIIASSKRPYEGALAPLVHVIMAAGDDSKHFTADLHYKTLFNDDGDFSAFDNTVGLGPLSLNASVSHFFGYPRECQQIEDALHAAPLVFEGHGCTIKIFTPPTRRTGEPSTGSGNSDATLAAHLSSIEKGPHNVVASMLNVGFEYKSRVTKGRNRAGADAAFPSRLQIIDVFAGTTFLKMTWVPMLDKHGALTNQAVPQDSRSLKMGKCIRDPVSIYKGAPSYEQAAAAFLADNASSYANCPLFPVSDALCMRWLDLPVLRRRHDTLEEEDQRQSWRVQFDTDVCDLDYVPLACDPEELVFAFHADCGEHLRDARTIYNGLYPSALDSAGGDSWTLALELAAAIKAGDNVHQLYTSPLIGRLLTDYS
jgi:hypothetical protein